VLYVTGNSPKAEPVQNISINISLKSLQNIQYIWRLGLILCASLDLSTSTSTAKCCAPFFNTEGWYELIQRRPLGPAVPVQSEEETQFGKLEMLGLLFFFFATSQMYMHKKVWAFFFAPHSDLKKEAQASMVSTQCSASINTSLAIQLPACWQIWCHLLRPPWGCNGISALRPALGRQ